MKMVSNDLTKKSTGTPPIRKLVEYHPMLSISPKKIFNKFWSGNPRWRQNLKCCVSPKKIFSPLSFGAMLQKRKKMFCCQIAKTNEFEKPFIHFVFLLVSIRNY
jgi:hypothetical protein